MYRIILLTLFVLFFCGCGSSGSNNSSTSNTGYLIDAPISGVEYTCDDISGITGTKGEFNYNNTCNVIFKIGGILIGEIDTSNINEDKNVLPADLIGVSRDNTEDEKVVKLIQFLQTIDDDDNPDNNIQITKEAREKLKDCFLDFTTSANEEHDIIQVLKLVDKKLISKEKALIHYKKTLKTKFNIEIVKTKNEKFNPDNQIEIEKTSNLIIETIIEEKIEDLTEDIINNEVEEETNNYVKKIVEDEHTEITTVEKKISDQDDDTNKTNEQTETSVENKEVEEVEEVEEDEEVNEPSEETKSHFNNIEVNLETVDIEEEDKEDKGFSYENQRDVKINISTKENLHNKQVLIYEKITILNTPVGDFEKLENIIISTIFDENGELNLTYTLGNHITSIWLVVPFYGLTIEVPITNNNIYLTLDN